MTIPKSQGKQPFYDARKSSWGDLFPHEPKNRPLERFRVDPLSPHPSGTKDDHIGKRGNKARRQQQSSKRHSYEGIADELKLGRQQARRARSQQLDATGDME
jgi:ribosomal protein RSM22 (predicted rRNA methylase)